MIRGTLYSAAFLRGHGRAGAHLGRPGALIAFPAAVLVGFAFGALGMALSTFMRSWQDFDLMASAQFALFLFSGTFVPAHDYPAVLRWVVEVTPLYRSVDLIRGVTTALVELGAAGRHRVPARPGRARPGGGGPPDGDAAVQMMRWS